MICLKVVEPDGQKTKLNRIQGTAIFLLGLVIPRTNPDFDNKIDQVAVWLIEFADENSVPQREIGLNKAGDVIMKMPYKKNYGYWTDNDLPLSDFQQHFKIEFISKDQFEETWNSAFNEL